MCFVYNFHSSIDPKLICVFQGKRGMRMMKIF